MAIRVFLWKPDLHVPQPIHLLGHSNVMLIRTLAILALLSVPAMAQDACLRYASFPSLATAQALSASAWQAVQCTPQPSCDPAQITQFNYPIITLVNGNSAIVIHSGDVYQGEHLSLPNGKAFDLTADQIAALQSAPRLARNCPPSCPWRFGKPPHDCANQRPQHLQGHAFHVQHELQCPCSRADRPRRIVAGPRLGRNGVIRPVYLYGYSDDFCPTDDRRREALTRP